MSHCSAGRGWSCPAGSPGTVLIARLAPRGGGAVAGPDSVLAARFPGPAGGAPGPAGLHGVGYGDGVEELPCVRVRGRR